MEPRVQSLAFMDKRTVAWIAVWFLLMLAACQPTPAPSVVTRPIGTKAAVSPSDPASTIPVRPSPAVEQTPTPQLSPVGSEISLLATTAPTASEPSGQQASPGTPTPTGAPLSEPTQVQAFETVPCNRAAPGNPIDITIPDGTSLRPEEPFSKTWRLKNSGACTWTREYTVVWFSGERFGVPDRLLLSNPVVSGETVDITIDMRAPVQAGSYQGNWKLVDAQGAYFGIGPNGDAPFWVRVLVVEDTTPTPEPSLTPTPTPEVYANALAVLVPNSQFDLDANQAGESPAADLSYAVEDVADGAQHRLIPINGAQVGDYLTAVPDLPDCQAAALTGEALDLDGATPGSYFCYHTGQGLPGWGRLVLLDPTSGTLAFEFLTWAVP
jgi:hypothetical protein